MSDNPVNVNMEKLAPGVSLVEAVFTWLAEQDNAGFDATDIITVMVDAKSSNRTFIIASHPQYTNPVESAAALVALADALLRKHHDIMMEIRAKLATEGMTKQ